MRVVALISGAGHEIVALANLQPAACNGKDEIDSYMYQTVGHDGIDLYSESLGLPLFRRVIAGNAVVQDKEYSPTPGDEVEDLFELLADVKKSIQYDGIAVGAILSDYQRIRVENVCKRLGCVCLAYLWRRDQVELLQEMIDCGVNAIIIKTASLGLDPDVHLGQSISEMQTHLLESKGKYGINVCGEGGEYETFTLDCPLFKQKIVLDDYEKIIHSNDAFAPVGYLKLKKAHLVNKNDEGESVSPDSENRVSDLKKMYQKFRLNGLPVKSPLDYLKDLIECTNADCCDGHVELCTLESGDKPHGLCCKSLDTHQDEKHLLKEGESHNNGDLRDVPIPVPHIVPLCQHVRQTLPFPENTLRVTGNTGGWLWVMGIQGRNTETNAPMKDALRSLKHIIENRGMSLADLISICMYVSDMDDYAQFNSEYNEFFESQPPVRVCVEASLPKDIPILMEAVAYSVQPGSDGSMRQCMHVQGISHWAPANIGPYSQAIWVGDIIYVAGQIGLVPGSMTLVPGDAKMECKLALRSLNRQEYELLCIIGSYPDDGICYVTDVSYIADCRHEWEKLTNNAIVEYLVVPRLPRNAKIEWFTWIHKHNAAFEYEETGCYVGSGIKIRIIRRWNYENRVSAIVCRATISNEESVFGRQELKEMIEYGLSKLLRDAEKYVECSVRLFYKAVDPRRAVDPSEIFNTLEEECSKYSIAFSILPVSSLMVENTLVSLCGVRH
ncbi:Diphthine--ammonia ligase [Folsomia candida]|uniref:Diphthine--ammonia ligase n=1 Tax=Folsomia candida TaxID=158441 RepID=A0A226ETC1_FOLCA|nr:Diphthine--ammonia ligase [Folsomia candida]